MNEPVVHAQATTGKLTAKALLKVVATAREGMYVHGAACADRASYSDAFTFTLSAVVSRASKERGTCETVTKVDVPGWVSNGSTSEREERVYDFRKVVSFTGVHRPSRGYWSLGYNDRLRDALRLLPPDAEVALHVYLDAGTHEYLIRAECGMNFGRESGMHADHLYLVATWARRGKRQEVKFLLDVSVGPHNTARFGVGR